LGEVAIDFTEGTESSGRANSGEVFAGERVPDFGEAIAKMLEIIAPVATEATATFRQLESTAQNLSHITDENSELNLALTQFKTLGEHLNQLTGPESALSSSLMNLKQITADLTKNDNITVTLQNFRTSSEKLKSTLTSLGPSLQTSADNVKDATATLKSQPWRLIWPSTKKYPEESPPPNIKAAKAAASPRSSPTPTRRASR
jgi:prefoldin subunit 5